MTTGVTRWRMSLSDRCFLRLVRMQACNDNAPGQLDRQWGSFQAALLRFRIQQAGLQS